MLLRGSSSVGSQSYHTIISSYCHIVTRLGLTCRHRLLRRQSSDPQARQRPSDAKLDIYAARSVVPSARHFYEY